MSESSDSSPSLPPDGSDYPAVWTRRVLVAMAMLGVAVVVAAVVWGSSGTKSGQKAASHGQVGSAEAGTPTPGSPRGTTSGSTGAAPTTGTSLVPASAPGGASTPHGTSRPTIAPPGTSTPPTTAAPSTNFYDRGSVGPCPVAFSGSAGGAGGGSTGSSSQATAVANCLVHAWAWKLTATGNGLVGMDALASPALIPTLLNFGHYLNHLQLASGGCSVDGATAACTFTDGATNLLLSLQQGAAFTYGWLATDASLAPATPGSSTTLADPAAPPPSGTQPAPAPAGASS